MNYRLKLDVVACSDKMMQPLTSITHCDS